MTVRSQSQYYKTTIVAKASLTQPQLAVASLSQPQLALASLSKPQLVIASLSQPQQALASHSKPQLAIARITIVNYDPKSIIVQATGLIIFCSVQISFCSGLIFSIQVKNGQNYWSWMNLNKYEETVVVSFKSNLLLMSFCLHIINYNS